MATRMTLQMERATRVTTFSRVHPSDLPAYEPAVKQLEALLARLGDPATFLTNLATQLGQYVALIDQRTEGYQARLGARRQFDGVAREMRVVVDQLHAINRHRLGCRSGDFAFRRAIRSVRGGGGRTTEAPPAGEGTRGIIAPIALPPDQPLA